MRKTEEMNGAGAIRSHAAGWEMEDVLQGSAGQGGQKGSKVTRGQ